jgi:hypothetical protein
MLPLVWSAFSTSTPSLKQHIAYIQGSEQPRQHAILAPQGSLSLSSRVDDTSPSCDVKLTPEMQQERSGPYASVVGSSFCRSRERREDGKCSIFPVE